jgi:hypothetical protein
MTNTIAFAGNLEQALIEFDPFYAGFAIPGSMTFGIGYQPCYAPSRTRMSQMKIVREIEMFPSRFPPFEFPS